MHSVLFLQDIIQVYCTAGDVNEYDVVTDMSQTRDKTVKLKDGRWLCHVLLTTAHKFQNVTIWNYYALHTHARAAEGAAFFEVAGIIWYYDNKGIRCISVFILLQKKMRWKRFGQALLKLISDAAEELVEQPDKNPIAAR